MQKKKSEMAHAKFAGIFFPYRNGVFEEELISSSNKLFSKLDCIFIPTTSSPSFRLKANLDDPMKMYLSDMFTVPFNLIGSPALNIPGGKTKKNLPIGFQIVGDSFKEETLFRFAHSLERARLFK